MATRKIKDAKDIKTSELIYFRGHAGATFMSDGRTVEDAINNISIGDLTNVATKTDLESKQDIITDLDTIRAGATLGSTAIQPSTLATVATSGSYNDLSNKPTIPSAVTESTVSGWGFTKNTGTYSKPSTGIPKSDLASDIQTSLGKADTALQSYTEQYKGTVTGVKINGTTKNPTSGVVDLGTVITSHQDISGKQDKLVSGTNIKTINGTSILGSGNITIEGGSQVDLSEYAKKSEIPTKTSQLTNDSGFFTTEDTDGSVEDVGDTITQEQLDSALLEKQDVILDLATIRSGASKGATAVQPSNLATVATSGSYTDLTNKPTEVTDTTVSNWGYTKNAGTITGVSANGTSVATSGVANIPAASTSKYGVTKLSSSTSSTSTSLAATASAVKAAYDLAASKTDNIGTVTGVKINGSTKNPTSGVVDLGTVLTTHQDISGKQDKLVSGTNIKTLNGQSILGSGDIEITGGGSDSIYIFDMFAKAGDDDHFTITVEEEAAIMAATIVVEPTLGLIADAKLLYEGDGTISFPSIWHNMILVAKFSNYVCYPEFREDVIPTATSQLENDSNFVSSDNLKTINGQSIVGSGNITISGGGGSSSGGGKEIVEIGDSYTEIEPNKIYVVTEELHAFEIIDIFITTDNPVDEYTIHFKMANPTFGGWMPWFIVPEDIVWANGVNPPELEKGVSYEMSVIKTTINGSDVFKGVITPFKAVEE